MNSRNMAALLRRMW